MAIFTEPGAAIATILHAVGAIGYLAGLGMYVVWQRDMQAGFDNPRTLANAAGATYISILVNLLGGFIRTYQPGHPSLTAFADEPWVVLMVLKHAALFIGIGLAAYLFEVAAPRIRRRAKAGKSWSAKGPDAAAAGVLASILVAAVLGGVSTVVDIGQPPAPPDMVPPPLVYEGETHWFNGTVNAGEVDMGSFLVPEQAQSIVATITMNGQTIDPNQVTLVLIDPTGAQRSATTQTLESPKQATLEYDGPMQGRWQFQVRTDAVQAPWSLVIDVR